MFARPSSGMFDPESSSDKTRVFDTEYLIKANGEEYRCKLTTEWVGTDITEGAQGNNYLQALIIIPWPPITTVLVNLLLLWYDTETQALL